MSKLKNKSEMNVGAAEFLHTKCYYPSVIHCAYYSYVQLMKHIWLYSMCKTEDDMVMLNRKSKEGSHEVLINQLRIHLNSCSLNARDFNNTIGQLKKLRVEADYKDIEIDIAKSEKSIALSKMTLNILRKCL